MQWVFHHGATPSFSENLYRFIEVIKLISVANGVDDEIILGLYFKEKILRTEVKYN